MAKKTRNRKGGKNVNVTLSLWESKFLVDVLDCASGPGAGYATAIADKLAKVNTRVDLRERECLGDFGAADLFIGRLN